MTRTRFGNPQGRRRLDRGVQMCGTLVVDARLDAVIAQPCAQSAAFGVEYCELVKAMSRLFRFGYKTIRIAQSLLVAQRQRLPCCDPLIELRQFDAQQGRLQFIKAAVVAAFAQVSGAFAVIAQTAQALGLFLVSNP